MMAQKPTYEKRALDFHFLYVTPLNALQKKQLKNGDMTPSNAKRMEKVGIPWRMGSLCLPLTV